MRDRVTEIPKLYKIGDIMATAIQVQSVIYHNDKESLLRAYQSLANAVRVSAKRGQEIKLVVHYGDASKAPVYSEEEILALQAEFGSYFTFRYTFFNENTGTSKGHNRVGLGCNADYIVVMNPDVIVCPRFFEKMMLPFLDSDKNAGITEARQVPLEHPKEYDCETLETEWATGACFMIPAALYQKIGGFDEKTFFMYCDDVDISWRVRLEEKKIYYRPDCPVYHAKRLSATANWVPTEAELQAAFDEIEQEFIDEAIAQYLYYAGKTEDDLTEEERNEMIQDCHDMVYNNFDTSFFEIRAYYRIISKVMLDWPEVSTFDDRRAYPLDK